MNPSNPIRLSLAMTTYNAEVYLIEQLESIRLQTMPFDEVVIVDDASRDHTVEKIREYIATYHLAGRWFLHVHTENTGFVRGFRDALSRTRGEYIFLSDHDDIWKPEKVEHMMKMFDKHVELLALASSFSLIDAQDRPIEGKSSSRRSNHNLIRRPLPRGQFSWLTFEDLMGYNVSPGCTLALTRRLKDEYLSTPVDMNLPHDWAICAIAAIQNGLGYLDEELMGYRQHPGNTLGLTRRSDYESRLHASWQDYLQKEALLSLALQFQAEPQMIGKMEEVRSFYAQRAQALSHRSLFELSSLLLSHQGSGFRLTLGMDIKSILSSSSSSAAAQQEARAFNPIDPSSRKEEKEAEADPKGNRPQNETDRKKAAREADGKVDA